MTAPVSLAEQIAAVDAEIDRYSKHAVECKHIDALRAAAETLKRMQGVTDAQGQIVDSQTDQAARLVAATMYSLSPNMSGDVWQGLPSTRKRKAEDAAQSVIEAFLSTIVTPDPTP